jgi:hypothetical protein
MSNHGFLGTGKSVRDWIYGVDSELPEIVNKNWKDYLPIGEEQCQNGLETMSCVSHSLCNALEIREKVFGNNYNFSDRALATASGTTAFGNNFWTVWMTARKKGLCDENLWTFTGSTWDKYYEPLPINVENEMLEFTKKYDIGLSWVDNDKISEALCRAPVWAANSGHAFVIVGEKDSSTWCVYDTYPTSDGDFIGEMPKSSITASALVWLKSKFVDMNIEEEIKEFEGYLVMDSEQSGSMGWVKNGMLLQAKPERVAEMVANYLVEKEGIGLSANMWNAIKEAKLIEDF